MLLSLMLVMLFSTACATRNKEVARDYYNLGTGYLDAKNYVRAREYYERALDLDPSLAQASYNLARVYLLIDRVDEAIDILQDLLRRDADNLMVRETLAYAWSAQGEWQRSADIMEAVVDDNDVSARGWLNYSITLLEIDRFQAAGQAADKALLLQPDNESARFVKVIAVAYSTPDDLVDLEGQLGELYAKAPSRRLVIELGDALETAGRFDLALDLYTATVEKYDDDGELSFRRARILIEVVDDRSAGVDALVRALSKGMKEDERLLALVSQVEDELPAGVLGDEGDDGAAGAADSAVSGGQQQ